jgi:peptide/nickel transport system substrate-binding protein
MRPNNLGIGLAVLFGLSPGLLVPRAGAAGKAPVPAPIEKSEEVLLTSSDPGRYGSRLTSSLHSGPKTFNPVTAVDVPSLAVIRQTLGDLIHINRFTQKAEPALAKSWKVSADGKHFTLTLRRGIRFSDGQPFDAEDVVFTFTALLDESVHAPERDLLTINGKPIQVRKSGPYTVEVDLPESDAAAERIFDSVAILPMHLLAKAYAEKRLGQEWGLNTPPGQMAGLGPFRLKEYVPGQYVVLERNPYYWKADARRQRLPYVDELVYLIVSSTDAEVLRFRAGEIDVLSPLSADNFAALSDTSHPAYQLQDLGPGLEYNFLFFNLNELPLQPTTSEEMQKISKEQAWFQDVRFRRAISRAIDREGAVRLIFRGRAAPLWALESPGNKNWVDATLPHPAQSIPEARRILQEAGFKWNDAGDLVDPAGNRVEFSIITSSSNALRTRMATLLQDDLKQLGMEVHVVPLESRSLLDRMFQSYDYEACLSALANGDADPNPEMNVWLLDGGTHLWRLRHEHPAEPWETELDHLMRQQLVTRRGAERKKLYDRVQEIVEEYLPLICIASPDVLVASKTTLSNLQPGVIPDYALWNSDVIYFKENGGKQP